MPTAEDYKAIFDDPVFRALPGYVKIAKLKEYDPDFASMSTKDQADTVFGFLNPKAEKQIEHPPVSFSQLRLMPTAREIATMAIPMIAGGAGAAYGSEIGEGMSDVPAAFREGVRTAGQRPWGDWRSRGALAAPIELGLEAMGVPRGVGLGIDAATLAAPKVSGFGRGFMDYMKQEPYGPEYQPPPPPPAPRTPGWMKGPGPSQRPMPSIDPIRPLTPPPGNTPPAPNRQETFDLQPTQHQFDQTPMQLPAAAAPPPIVDITGSPFARGTPAPPPAAAPGQPLPRQAWTPPTQQELPLQEPGAPMQRIGMHHIVKFAKDNGIPFADAHRMFANEGYIGDWDVMGP